MSEISIYDIVPTPKLADKLIGTSVGGVIEDVTYNFTLQELLQLFIPNIPANTLQGVLDYGNTATQNINLTGTITTTNLSVLATANILNSNLSGNTRVMAGLFDRTNASGTAGQFLRSTGTQVEWFTIPTVIPTLQQVLQSGNTSNISIVLTANITAVTATAGTVISNTSLNVNGVLRDGIAAVGASNQILSSTGSGVRWVDMPVYNVVSPLLYDTPTKTFSIQVASSSQSGYLSSADWINFDGKQDAIILTTSGTSGAATFVANTLNIPVYSPDLSGYVPTSRTLTINGVTYDLSANRSWTIAAGVASVTATAPLSSSGGANPDISISQSDSSTDGYLSSVDWIDFNSKQDGLNGTGLVKSTAGVITYITDNSTNWNTAYNDSIVSAAVTGTATKTLTLNQQDGGTIQASWSDIDTGLTSVGVSMPSAFSVANSPLTSNGTIAITGAGTSLQYVDGTGALQTFPGLTGFVPYTGATTNVDLGVYSLTASALIKSGGTSSQFLKADGTVDSTSYQPFITAGTTSQYYRGDKTFQTLDTTVVPEGTNLYYLDSRARAALSFAAGSGAYNSTTGVITIPTNTNQLTNGASFITLSSLSAASPLSYNNLTGAFSISQAGASTDGYLSSTDWTTFNAKQVAGNYIVSLTGEATAVGPGAAAVTLNNASVTGKVLTGVNITGGTVLATDTMLTAFGKLQNQINGLIGSTIYQGVWDASSNTPTLTSSVGTNGFYYIVNVAGSTNLNGITDWKIGDWAIFNGGVWQKVDNTESVTSVNGFTGAVSLTTDNVAQGTTNLYFANSLARAAISLTVTGSSGASTYNNTTGVLNVPTYTLSGLGGQPLATNLTSLSGLTFASTSFVKMTAAGTFALDTNTYALSSALANYLPLAGGTLTGALGGTTASFSGAVSTNAPSGGATGEGLVVGQSFKIDGSGTSQRAVMYVVSNVLSDTYGSGLQIQGANLADDKGFGFNLNTTGGFELYVKNTSYNKALTIANTKAATFADTVTATSLIKTGGTSAQFLKADGSVDSTTYGTGTVTSVAALTIGTTGTDLSSTVATGTTTPVITLNVPTASAANRGALSAADWTTFNNKASTAALANYLPLAGGTLTGALSGTSATFSSTLTSVGATINGANNAIIDLYNTALADTNARNWRIVTNESSWGALEFRVSTANNNAPSSAKLILAKDGAATFSSGIATAGYTANTSYAALFGGTVGIGVTTPTNQLHIYGGNSGVTAPDSRTRLRVESSGEAYISMNVPDASYTGFRMGTPTNSVGAYIEYEGSTGNTSFIVIPTGYLRFGTASTERMRIFAGGNVFVGSSPTDAGYKLDVNGTGRFVTSTNGFVTRFTGGATSGVLGGFYANSTAGFASIGVQSNHEFRLFTNDTDRLTIAAGGAATFSSNLSIGGESNIYGGLSGLFAIQNGNSSYYSYDQEVGLVANAYYGSGWKYKTSNFATRYLQNTGTHAWSTATSGTANGALSWSEKMRISNDGNVGIGTTSPSATLHVKASSATNIYLESTGSAVYQQLVNSGGSAYIGSSSNDLLFLTNAAGNERMRIISGGQVGIGTTSPAAQLDIQAARTDNLTLLKLGTNNASTGNGDKVNIDFYSYGNNYLNGRISREIEAYSTYAGALTFATGASGSVTERMRITSGGNVLIGTSTDAGYKLDVNGTGRFSGSAQEMLYATSSIASGTVFRLSNTSTGGGDFRFYSTGSGNGEGAGRLVLNFNGASAILNISGSTGAATFISSITATSFFESSSVAFKNILATNPLTSLNVDVIKYKRTNVDVDDVRYGYSAEQINSLMPELTNKEATAVKYLDVHTLLIAELQREIKELKAKLNN